MEEAGPQVKSLWDTPSFRKKRKKLKRYRFFYILHIIKLSHTKRTTNAKQNCCFSHWTDEILIFLYAHNVCHYRSSHLHCLPTWLNEKRQVTVTIMYQFIYRESHFIFIIFDLFIMWFIFISLLGLYLSHFLEVCNNFPRVASNGCPSTRTTPGIVLFNFIHLILMINKKWRGMLTIHHWR